jgi:hypothetical protein
MTKHRTIHCRYFLKYAMSMVDLWLDGRWESKGTYVFYLELVTDLLHLFVYVLFFGMVREHVAAFQGCWSMASLLPDLL